MAPQSYLVRGLRQLPLIALLALLLVVLYLAAGATTSESALAANYPWILGASVAALVIILGALIHRLFRLRQRIARQEPGALFTRRLVIVFVALSVPPALIVFAFSLGFLTRSVESWFDVGVEGALDDALSIGQIYLESRQKVALDLTRQIAADLTDLDGESRVRRLGVLVDRYGADELTIFGAGLTILGTSFRQGGTLTLNFPNNWELFLMRDNGFYSGADPTELHVRVLLPLENRAIGSEGVVLQALFPWPERYEGLAQNVEDQFESYGTLAFLRSKLEQSFALVLSLVLLLSVLLAVLLAFNTARRLVRPMGQLSEATQRVAGGDFAQTLPIPARDDLGFLVQSFNAMTQRLSETSRVAERSRQETEQQRNYLEGLLSRLSSGVISFGHEGELITSNRIAGSILGFPAALEVPAQASDIKAQCPWLRPLLNAVDSQRSELAEDWVEEIALERGEQRQILMCRGARLLDSALGQDVQVVVVDDVTNLIQAQREAAWGEVARRMAHEVKNPLTPIQLSAERLRRRYLTTLPEEDARLLDRCTATIVNQVQALKHMVNAFSEYARAPQLRLESVKLSSIVEEITALYQSGDNQLQVSTDWTPDEPKIAADSGRIRQLVHNLIKNAQEAVEQGPLALSFRSEVVRRNERPFLALTVEDNGPGVPREIMDRLFEPYATTKPRGTGLGLSIVKKITEEHGGTIRASNTAQRGATFTVEIPVERREQPRPEEQRQL